MSEKIGLSHEAYGGIKGEDYIPYIPVTRVMPEITLASILWGLIFAVVFGAANTYLGLRVGMTIAAGIPAAILGTGILKGILKRNNILEANVMQALASMGESLAGGLIFVVPAIILIGQKLSLLTIFLVSLCGSILGVLFVVPLRKYLIVEEHGVLTYPEGMAASEVLVSGSSGGEGLRTMTKGVAVGAAYKLLSGGFALWSEEPQWIIKPYQGTIFGIDVLASLLGVGYIVGLQIDLYMFAGAVAAWFGLIPLVKYFGNGLTNPIFPSTVPIAQMTATAIWKNYIRYVGAGGVAAGGFISISKAMPTIIKSFRSAIGRMSTANKGVKRTELDVPMNWVIVGAILIFFLTWLVPMANTQAGPVGAFLGILFSFFFAVVSARIVGIIGTSNNPISGMTITTLLLVTSILKATGKIGNAGMVASLIIGGIVCVATAIAGGAAQSLKTTYIIGGTPKHLEMSMLLASIVSAVPVGFIILLLDKAYTLGGEKVPAPQAVLMSMIVKGIMNSQVPWTLVIIGVALGIMCELVQVPVLPFALGLYLPIHLSTGILVGGIVRYFVDRKFKNNVELMKAHNERGVLLSSGLVAGDALVGILIAVFAIANVDKVVAFGNTGALSKFTQNPWLALVIVILLAIWVYKYTCKADAEK